MVDIVSGQDLGDAPEMEALEEKNVLHPGDQFCQAEKTPAEARTLWQMYGRLCVSLFLYSLGRLSNWAVQGQGQCQEVAAFLE